MAVLSSDLIRQGASGVSTGYTIDQSIRFNDNDSSRLYRTPGSAGDRRTHTFSVWLKRANLDASGFKNIFSRSEASYFYGYYFYQDKLTMGSGSSGTEMSLRTNRLFRDPAAWYHLVLILDTTQAVASERARMYINGVRELGNFNQETYPSLNAQLWMNTTSLTEIGVANPSGSKSGYFDGLMTDIYFLDGYAYGPEYFGEFDSNGIWIPKEYEEGNYGTNGFKFTGADSSSFGTDESGTGNNFTVAGLAAHDQVLDTPTNNYCVMSPLDTFLGTNTFADGNLLLTGSSQVTSSTISVSSGKWYVEVRKNANADNQIGVITGPTNQPSSQLGSSQFRRAWRDNNNSPQFLTDSGTAGSGTAESLSAGDILGIALDLDNDAIYFADNNTWMNSGDPTSGSSKTGANWTDLNLYDEWRWFIGSNSNGINATWNFGQDGTFGGTETAQGNKDGNGHGNFYYAPPSGYLAVNTKNLGK